MAQEKGQPLTDSRSQAFAKFKKRFEDFFWWTPIIGVPADLLAIWQSSRFQRQEEALQQSATPGISGAELKVLGLVPVSYLIIGTGILTLFVIVSLINRSYLNSKDKKGVGPYILNVCLSVGLGWLYLRLWLGEAGLLLFLFVILLVGIAINYFLFKMGAENQYWMGCLAANAILGIVLFFLCMATGVLGNILNDIASPQVTASDPLPTHAITESSPALVDMPPDRGGIQNPEPSTSISQSSIATGTIGYSVQGRNIDFTRIGNGPQIIIIAAALHGTESNAAKLVENLQGYFQNTVEITGNDFTYYFLPKLNPDGLVTGSRYNANGVDLNRNWDTSNWQSDTVDNRGSAKGSGGSAPFSEPETKAFANFLIKLHQESGKPIIVLNYHARHPPNGLVQPSYRIENQTQISDPNAYGIAEQFASQLGYDFSPIWDEYPITGEAIHWCGEHGIICMDIELPSLQDLTPSQTQSHLQAIVKVIQK